MTIKQIIVGTLMGACAFSSMIQRMPKPEVPAEIKPVAKHSVRASTRVARRVRHKHTVEARLSMNKLFD